MWRLKPVYVYFPLLLVLLVGGVRHFPAISSNMLYVWKKFSWLLLFVRLKICLWRFLLVSLWGFLRWVNSWMVHFLKTYGNSRRVFQIDNFYITGLAKCNTNTLFFLKGRSGTLKTEKRDAIRDLTVDSVLWWVPRPVKSKVQIQTMDLDY